MTLAALERDGDADGTGDGVTEGDRVTPGERPFEGEAVDPAGDSGRLVEDDNGLAPCAVPSALIGSARGGS